MRLWVQTLVGLIALAMVLDHLAPRSAMRRDVQMVTGLVILLAMLQPLLGWVRGGWAPDWERLEASARAALAPDPRLSSGRPGAGPRGWHDDAARRVFAGALARRAEAAVLAVAGVVAAQVEVELEPAGSRPGAPPSSRAGGSPGGAGAAAPVPGVRAVRVAARVTGPLDPGVLRAAVARALALAPEAVEVRVSGP